MNNNETKKAYFEANPVLEKITKLNEVKLINLSEPHISGRFLTDSEIEAIEKRGIVKALEMLKEYAIDYSASTNYLSDGIELLENFLGIKKEPVDFKDVL